MLPNVMGGRKIETVRGSAEKKMELGLEEVRDKRINNPLWLLISSFVKFKDPVKYQRQRLFCAFSVRSVSSVRKIKRTEYTEHTEKSRKILWLVPGHSVNSPCDPCFPCEKNRPECTLRKNAKSRIHLLTFSDELPLRLDAPTFPPSRYFRV